MSDCGEKVKELAARKIRGQFGVKSVDLKDKYPVIEAEFVTFPFGGSRPNTQIGIGLC